MRAVWEQRSGYRPINACSLRSPDRKQGQDQAILPYRNLFLIAPLASVVCDRLIANSGKILRSCPTEWTLSLHML